MKNKPGISWGVEHPVNLMRSSKGWLAVYYHPDGEREIIKIFKPKDLVDYLKMLETATIWNYGTCELCPVVRAEIDWTT